MNTKYKGHNWSEQTKFINEVWEDYDFSGTNFENAIFKTVTFKNCNFLKSKIIHMGVFGCTYIECIFEGVAFKSTAIGAEGGLYKGCTFKKCDFQGQSFNYPHFDNCVFDNCKLKKIDFNDASFANCKFIGKLEDVTFNGMYHEKSTGYKPLDKVDFSKAVFDEFVTFDDCDLSTCIPPVGHTFEELLYQIYSNVSTILSTGSKDKIVLVKR